MGNILDVHKLYLGNGKSRNFRKAMESAYPSYYVYDVVITEDDIDAAHFSWNIIMNEENIAPYLEARKDPNFDHSSCLTWFFDLFYERFFVLCPDARAMFVHVSMAAQGRLLAGVISTSLGLLKQPEKLRRRLIAIVDSHNPKKITSNLYGVMGDALFWSFDQVLGERFDSRAQQAWARVYSFLLSIIIPRAVAYETQQSRRISSQGSNQESGRESSIHSSISSRKAIYDLKNSIENRLRNSLSIKRHRNSSPRDEGNEGDGNKSMRQPNLVSENRSEHTRRSQFQPKPLEDVEEEKGSDKFNGSDCNSLPRTSIIGNININNDVYDNANSQHYQTNNTNIAGEEVNNEESVDSKAAPQCPFKFANIAGLSHDDGSGNSAPLNITHESTYGNPTKLMTKSNHSLYYKHSHQSSNHSSNDSSDIEASLSPIRHYHHPHIHDNKIQPFSNDSNINNNNSNSPSHQRRHSHNISSSSNNVYPVPKAPLVLHHREKTTLDSLPLTIGVEKECPFKFVSPANNYNAHNQYNTNGSNIGTKTDGRNVDSLFHAQYSKSSSIPAPITTGLTSSTTGYTPCTHYSYNNNHSPNSGSANHRGNALPSSLVDSERAPYAHYLNSMIHTSGKSEMSEVDASIHDTRGRYPKK